MLNVAYVICEQEQIQAIECIDGQISMQFNNGMIS